MHAAEPPQGATPEPTPGESSELHGGLDATVRFYACEWPLLRRLSGCFGSSLCENAFVIAGNSIK
jgi:hypothetical protein